MTHPRSPSAPCPRSARSASGRHRCGAGWERVPWPATTGTVTSSGCHGARDCRSTISATRACPSARRAERVRSGSRSHSSSPSKPAQELLGGVLRTAGLVGRHGGGGRRRARPPRLPRQRRLVHADGVDGLGSPHGGRQGHVAAVAVADERRVPPVEEVQQVVDVGLAPVRTGQPPTTGRSPAGRSAGRGSGRRAAEPPGRSPSSGPSCRGPAPPAPHRAGRSPRRGGHGSPDPHDPQHVGRAVAPGG